MIGEPFPNIVQAAIPAFVALLLLELALVRKRRRGRYEARDAAASVTMGLGSLAAGALVGGLVFGAHLWVYNHRLFTLERVWWVFVLCFFAQDLAYYWFHRLAHERRWMWASHIVHHSSEHYNLSTALRQTWTGFFSLSFLFTLPLALLGFEPAMIFLFAGISLVYQFWVHTEQITDMGPLEAVLNTPSHHRVHHANNPRYLDANYAGVLIVWDRLFGSFIPESPAEPPRYGLVKNIATYNPLRIATHEWLAILRDLRQARSLREALLYAWGPPGWSPDGSRRTSAELRAAWRAHESAMATGVTSGRGAAGRSLEEADQRRGGEGPAQVVDPPLFP